MSKIHSMMDMGKRSMMNNQTALQTVGHNIANKSTEGYSRQRVEITTAEPTGLGKDRIGNGSKTAQVTRTNNPFLERQIGFESGKRGFYKGQNEAMTRVEQVYNEQSNKGLNTFVGDFFNSIREFANTPESLATRTQVRESASFMAKDFQRVDKQLKDIAADLDSQVGSLVHDVNGITSEIAKLNSEIQLVTAQGGPANDERDRRDLLIKQLGEKINIKWAEGRDGTVTINAGNSALLVAGDDAKRLEARATPATDTKREGNFDVFYFNNEHSSPNRVTEQLTGGQIGGVLETRDKTIVGLLKKNDEMAYALANSVNDLHGQGFDAYGHQGNEFFETPMDVEGAAANLRLNDVIIKDPGRIAGAAVANSPADNRVANAISQLQYQSVIGSADEMPGAQKSATIDEFYNSIVGEVGIQSKGAQNAEANQENIVKQLSNLRESISGVSLDEETQKMIEFQKGFEASARIIKTADEMFDTVLNLKRL